MKMKIEVLIFTMLIGSLAHAQYTGDGTSETRPIFKNQTNAMQRGFAGYLAAGAGYAASNENDNQEGAPTSLKLLGSYVTSSEKGVFDAGYGVQNQNFSQNDAIESAISAGVMELATRYQFDNRWQLGAVYNQFFNTGENFNANQADVELGGVQILREFSFGENYIGRAGGRLMTSINIDNESLNMMIIDFQIGWGAPNQSTKSAWVE